MLNIISMLVNINTDQITIRKPLKEFTWTPLLG
jgi:hypothetical protein